MSEISKNKQKQRCGGLMKQTWNDIDMKYLVKIKIIEVHFYSTYRKQDFELLNLLD